MDIKNDMLWRVYLVLGLIVLMAMIVYGRAIYIYTVEGEQWRNLARKTQIEKKTMQGDRGNIITENGALLSTSIPFFELRQDLVPSGMTNKLFNENVDTLAYMLSRYVSDSATDGAWIDVLKQARADSVRYMLIKNNVSYEEYQFIKSFPIFREDINIGGFIPKKKPKRDRPFKILANRTVGYELEGVASVGLEGHFNEELSGESKEVVMQRVPGNNWIPLEDLNQIKLESGNDVVATLDMDIQDIVHDALQNALITHDAKYGTAIVMEVETGKIRAIANIEKTKEGWWELYNHAIGTKMEPGSTFKLASMMALLEDNKIKLSDEIDIEMGKTQFYDEEMVDASIHGLDTADVQTIFEVSSNVGIAKLVNEYYGTQTGNEQKFIDLLKNMGIGIPMGVEIDGEAMPVLKDADNDTWSGTTIPWMSIGYELEMTPLQLLAFYNAVANHGKMMKPYLVSEVRKNGQAVKRFKPTIINDEIASKETIQKAQQLLLGVVENGTARALRSEQFSFAGKTGTAQMNYSRVNGNRSSNIKHRASFAGYFPADNPKYSCIVVISDPKRGGYYGSTVALPVFRKIADEIYVSKNELHRALNTKEQPVLKERQLPSLQVGERRELTALLNALKIKHKVTAQSEMALIGAVGDSIRVMNRSLPEKQVPSVVGMGLRDAIYVLENRGLVVQVSGVGRVARQSIKPNTAARGQTVKLFLE